MTAEKVVEWSAWFVDNTIKDFMIMLFFGPSKHLNIVNM